MDSKKKMKRLFMLICSILLLTASVWAQKVSEIQFYGRSYEYGVGNDTITLYFNVIGNDGKRMSSLTADTFKEMLYFYEDELLAWVENGRKKTSEQNYDEVLANMQSGMRRKPKPRTNF